MVMAWTALLVMVLAYGLTDFLQAIAVSHGPQTHHLQPTLLLRLARNPTYVIAVGFQALGMMAAIVARRELPLFLVQASVGAGLVVTALLGVVLLRWRLPRAEIALIFGVLIGVMLLVCSAEPGPAKPVPAVGLLALALGVPILAACAHVCARYRGARGAVTLGALSGAAFGAAAIASRPLASAPSLADFFGGPLLYVFLAYLVAGQLFCALALQRGATTAAVAAMTAATAVPAAIVGIAFLGDAVKSGWGSIAVAGFVLTVVATTALARYAEPQAHSVVNPKQPAASETPHADPVASFASYGPRGESPS